MAGTVVLVPCLSLDTYLPVHIYATFVAYIVYEK
jgi:hypothetical protein